MRMELKAYGPRIKATIEWIEMEFPDISREERAVLLDKLLPPIAYWDGSDAVREGQREMRAKAPSSLAEKYPELKLETSRDERLMTFSGHIEERERFNEFISDARKEGWEWQGRGTKELIRK